MKAGSPPSSRSNWHPLRSVLPQSLSPVCKKIGRSVPSSLELIMHRRAMYGVLLACCLLPPQRVKLRPQRPQHWTKVSGGAPRCMCRARSRLETLTGLFAAESVQARARSRGPSTGGRPHASALCARHPAVASRARCAVLPARRSRRLAEWRAAPASQSSRIAALPRTSKLQHPSQLELRPISESLSR